MAPIDLSIKYLEKVIKVDGNVKNIEISRLTAPGENNLSLILRVNIDVEKNGHSKKTNLVVKCLPPLKPTGFDFNGLIMGNEIRWYSEIAPLLKEFAKESNIEMNFCPEYYGSRFSLDPSKMVADKDSVLVLGNLITQGYENDDRYTGFDLITTKAILKNLALLHALPIAIKIKNPEVFEVITKYVEKGRLKFPEFDEPDKLKNLFASPPGKKSREEMLLDALNNIPEFAPYMSKARKLLDGPSIMKSHDKLTKEPWNTLIHNDFWVNNVMINRGGKQLLVKIVDFQMVNYNSYAKDLVFFLLLSVRNDVMTEHMDDLLRFYYKEFTSILQKTNLNLKLNYEEYLEEVRNTAFNSEVGHALLFSCTVFAEKGTGVDTVTDENFDMFDHMAYMLKKMNQQQKDKMIALVSESIKRNWM